MRKVINRIKRYSLSILSVVFFLLSCINFYVGHLWKAVLDSFIALVLIVIESQLVNKKEERHDDV